MAELIESLSEELFWDVKKSAIDPDRHANWLVARVLERGRWEDWIKVRNHFGKENIREMAPSLRLDPKAENFLALYCRK